jgi:uncharacterized protein (DUF608 family)
MAATPGHDKGLYTGDYLSRIAFPLGGIGAGMICLEGSGDLNHMSFRNRMEFFFAPGIFSAICIKGKENITRVLQGPVPKCRYFGFPGSGNGWMRLSAKFPRFAEATFLPRFPFATVTLKDKKIPLRAELTGWSPFIPGNADDSSLPVCSLEYTFTNPTGRTLESVFSFNCEHHFHNKNTRIFPAPNGFILWDPGTPEKPADQVAINVTTDQPNAIVDHTWFRGGHFDTPTILWKKLSEGDCSPNPPFKDGPSRGASLFVPFRLKPGKSKTIRIMLAWHAPVSDLRKGKDPREDTVKETYVPWYAGKFKDVRAVAKYWRTHYDSLRDQSARFRDCFYDTTLPPEAVEAAAANLTILKSPTVLRQTDGRLWAWEGCADGEGSCEGSCTHVWNYAQALPHLFPDLERTFRETEFFVSQDDRGHQMFRSGLPIRPIKHDFLACADGQLGGIMRVYRDWKISGNTDWLKTIWPRVRQSLDYCIQTWDPDKKGIPEEPHHNTYDIEFWGPNGMCGSIYLGALRAAVLMGKFLNENVAQFESLYKKGKTFLERSLFNDEYFFQKTTWKTLRARDTAQGAYASTNNSPSPELLKIVKREGPLYQYGNGCLSDGVIGDWLAGACGVGSILDSAKVKKHLRSVYRYNFKKDLSGHANSLRPNFAMGQEAGLILCSWPHHDRPTLPFFFADEVWTGIEYQVASHMFMQGMTMEGLEIVRAVRNRYDGTARNPFNEYECGHWYARAMSSYGLLQGLTGIRYDAVEKTLYIQPKIKGNFRSFLSTATGYATVGIKKGKPFIDVKSGKIKIHKIEYKK